MKALVLTDGKAGHENQSKAFARALGCDTVLVSVSFKSRFHKALSYLLDRVGVRTLALFDVGEGWRRDEAVASTRASSSRGRGGPAASLPPDVSVVIGTGSGTFYAAKAAAKRLGVKCGVVLYPRGYDVKSFDCVMAPAFDRPGKAANVVEIPANLVANDDAFYEKGVAAFREHYLKTTGRAFDAHGAPAVAVIVGGPNKCSTMTADWMKRELDRIFAKRDVRFWVTTSRRTPPEVERLVATYPWDYALLYSKDRFNPIPAFVKLADTLCVTAESTGMLSEACTCGTARVEALDNLNPGPHKFRRFVGNLAEGGYVGGNRKVDLSDAFARAGGLLGLP